MRQDLHFQREERPRFVAEFARICVHITVPGRPVSGQFMCSKLKRWQSTKKRPKKCRHGEYYLLVLATTGGISFLVSCKHLKNIYIGISMGIFDWSATTSKPSVVFNRVALQVQRPDSLKGCVAECVSHCADTALKHVC